ncbi:ABC transporter permease [Acholeplasma laidlawii]|uniref:ABC transporter permease n=1 Tax=Acholeplasma laidlawii TaxID=2148 RepID=A0A553IG65_ACHLA|nr:ABC transporter permease [Acholeplasma laidlawii]NWH12192.1 ABC transporter permease [Acholeplasma laidlawii]NWH13578.1 ABC transporter permease [Acholeplasma laidlawii]NWH14255.1 ABC transporter permease [Acholeplasma laidlawii]OAN20141.1 hypothetical protein A2I99_02235 [Acholeplasma laidlawii]PII01488.1 ABC transporter permease [Acholeplasma laidlawii]
MNNINVDKSKFVFTQDKGVIYDEQLKTKAVGYYQDAWSRFKKNKASLIALIILIIIILMSVVGPHLRNYDLTSNSESRKWTDRLKEMPPRISGLEWFGFSGHKTLEGFPARFSILLTDPNAEGIIIGDFSQPNAAGMVKVKVDYYKYVDYINSYESVFSLSIKEYNLIKAYENENPGDKIIITDAPEVNGTYKVQIHFFKFLEVVYGHSNQDFWFGSTIAGDDLFTLMWDGLSVSLIIAFMVAAINIIVGIIVGSISGYYGGTLDLVIERISEILSGLPFMAILTLLLLRYGNTTWIVIIAFTLTGWLGISALTRAQFYRYKNREYVLAARTLGASDIRIMAKHIFPSTVGTLITSLVLYIPGVITSESTFAYLGIINYSNAQSFGALLSDGQSRMMSAFHLVIFPSLVISFMILAFNLFGNGLRDAFNPSLRGVEE